jgi:hypothetical protein
MNSSPHAADCRAALHSLNCSQATKHFHKVFQHHRVAQGIDPHIPDPYEAKYCGIWHSTQKQHNVFCSILTALGYDIQQAYQVSQEDIFTVVAKLSKSDLESLVCQARHHSSLRSTSQYRNKGIFSTASHPCDGASDTCSSKPSSVNSMAEVRDVPGQHGLSGQGSFVGTSLHGAIASPISSSSSSSGCASMYPAMQSSCHVQGPPQQVFSVSNVDYSQHGQFEVRVGPTNKAHLVFIGKAHYDVQPSGHHCVETPLPLAANRLDALRLSSGVQVRNMLRNEEQGRGCGTEASQSFHICQYWSGFFIILQV